MFGWFKDGLLVLCHLLEIADARLAIFVFDQRPKVMAITLFRLIDVDYIACIIVISPISLLSTQQYLISFFLFLFNIGVG